MDYFAAVAVVDGVDQLDKELVGLVLRKLAARLLLPQLIELPALQVLHDNDQLLLFGQWKVIEQLHDVAVLKTPKGFDLFGNHVRVFVALEVENLHGNLAIQEFVLG